MASPTEHCELSPSSAYRWMNSPGCVARERGLPDTDNIHSLTGTAAHTLAEMAIEEDAPCLDWLGDRIRVPVRGEAPPEITEVLEGDDMFPVEVTKEMADAVQMYVDTIREFSDGAKMWGTEERLTLEPLRPPAPMYGTCDSWFYYPELDLLRICDLKYGSGIVVEVEDNPQLRYYALMAWVKLAGVSKAAAARVKEIEIVIVQPRAFHPDGEIRSERFSFEELKEFKTKLLDAAGAAMQPNAKCVPGPWCRYCKARSTCPEFRDQALAVAQVEFGAIVKHEVTPPDPMGLTPSDMGAILDSADVLTTWLKVVEDRVRGELEAGRSVPGWALKPKRANRSWADEEALPKWAREVGIKKAELFTTKLRSPAQVEKLAKALGSALPEELVSRVSSGHNLCRDDDPKAMIPEAEFQVLSSTGEIPPIDESQITNHTYRPHTNRKEEVTHE